jgi:hypothetical protein
MRHETPGSRRERATRGPDSGASFWANPQATNYSARPKSGRPLFGEALADAIVRPASRGRMNAIARAHLAKVQRFEAMIGEYVGAGSAAACRRVPPR